jgi:hypothetical protein
MEMYEVYDDQEFESLMKRAVLIRSGIRAYKPLSHAPVFDWYYLWTLDDTVTDQEIRDRVSPRPNEHMIVKRHRHRALVIERYDYTPKVTSFSLPL